MVKKKTLLYKEVLQKYILWFGLGGLAFLLLTTVGIGVIKNDSSSYSMLTQDDSNSRTYYDDKCQVTFHLPSEDWSSKKSLDTDREIEKSYWETDKIKTDIAPSHWFVPRGMTISPGMLLLEEKQSAVPQVVATYTQEESGRGLGTHVYVNCFSANEDALRSTLYSYFSSLADQYNKNVTSYPGSLAPEKISLSEQDVTEKWGQEGVAQLKVLQSFPEFDGGSIENTIYVFVKGSKLYEVGYSIPNNDQELSSSALKIVDTLEFK